MIQIETYNLSDINNITEMRWNTFEQFKKRAFSGWICRMPWIAECWSQGKCTCPSFLKKYMCKHIIGIAIRSKYVKPPSQAKQVPIGEKRKRGRPFLAKKALLID